MPERFGQLENLRELKLWNCSSLKELPAGAPAHILPLSAALAILARIDRGISSSVLLNRSLSEGFGQLENLRELNLQYCPASKNMPAALKEQLQAQGCKTQM